MSAEFVERFMRFWAAPDPAALDELLHDDAHLVQPLMPEARSRAAYAQSTRRLLAVMPDLHGRTHRWGPTEDGVLIEHTLAGTLGGKALSWDLTDRITLRDGRVVERIAYFDPLPLLLGVVKRPRAWLRSCSGRASRDVEPDAGRALGGHARGVDRRRAGAVRPARVHRRYPRPRSSIARE